METSVTRNIRGFERRYRVLNLSELGIRVMRREEPDFEMVFPQVGALRPRAPRNRAARRAGGTAPQPLDGETAVLFEQLRKVRAALAEDAGVPPYAMGTNRLLRAIAEARPGDRGAMLELPGCGERMFDKVGRHYLGVVEVFEGSGEAG